MNQCSAQFQGFQPSEFTKTQVDEVLSSLQQQAPYGAALSASFVRENDKLKGTIKVNSAAGRFFAVAEGSRLSEVSRRLMDQMKRQLARWKAVRFQKNIATSA